MIDPELEAITKCTELLKNLDDEAKIRVLQYLVNRYKLTPGHHGGFPHNPTDVGANHQLPVATTVTPNAANARATYTNSAPALRDVVAKNYPKSEVEWVLVYCYYASEFGTRDFSRDEIQAQYELSKRWVEATRKNFSVNLKAVIRKDWIKSLANNEFVILDAGLTYVNEVLSGNSQTKARKSYKRRDKKASAAETE